MRESSIRADPNFEAESFDGYNPSESENPEEVVRRSEADGWGCGTWGSGGWGRGDWGYGARASGDRVGRTVGDTLLPTLAWLSGGVRLAILRRILSRVAASKDDDTISALQAACPAGVIMLVRWFELNSTSWPVSRRPRQGSVAYGRGARRSHSSRQPWTEQRLARLKWNCRVEVEFQPQP